MKDVGAEFGRNAPMSPVVVSAETGEVLVVDEGQGKPG